MKKKGRQVEYQLDWPFFNALQRLLTELADGFLPVFFSFF